MKDAPDYSAEILGSWVNANEIGDHPGLITELLYHFDSENAVRIERTVIDMQTEEVLGFRYFAEGEYTLNGSDLTVHRMEVYNSDGVASLFTDRTDLTLSDDTKEEKVRVTFEDSFNRLIFDYEPCGPYANCIEQQSFVKRN